MKKDIEKKEAGNFPKHNTLIMIVSIVTISLFIGMAVQPAISNAVEKKDKSHDLNLKNNLKGGCKTCGCMVTFTISYMINYVKDALKGKGHYPMISLDAVQLIFLGTLQGIANSGFNVQINKVHLKLTIWYYLNKMVGKQIFPSTMLVAALAAIGVGISAYLLSLCNNPNPGNVCHRCKNIEQIDSYNGIGPITRISFVILKRIIT